MPPLPACANALTPAKRTKHAQKYTHILRTKEVFEFISFSSAVEMLNN
jgi:hypothetical protein